MTSPAIASIPKATSTFAAPRREWFQTIGYCLLLSIFGLFVSPAILLLAMFLMWRWQTNRYAFLVELILFMGGFAFVSNEILPVKLWDLAFILGVVGIMIYRKNRLVRKLTWMTLGYIAILILLAMTSAESMKVQFLMMRRYFLVIAFFIPLLVFVNRDFDWKEFAHQVTLHVLVICGFYVVDTMILNGYVLLPASNPWELGATFTDIRISLFSFSFPRHYPPGLYWLFLLIVPINYGWVKLSAPQWVMVVLAVFATKTNSLLFALLICFALFRPQVKQALLWLLGGALLVVALYYVDSATGRHLRLADNIEQFTSLQTAQDEEDLAEFGTGRMAQIIPKWQHLSDMGRLDRGFGFLHPTKSTNPIFQIQNDFYSDISKSEEVATAVEVTQVQTILDCGWIGLLAQTLYFVGIYFVIRRLRYSLIYLCLVVGYSLLGVGGFAGLFFPASLLLITMVLGAIVLENRPKGRHPQPAEAK